MAKKKPFPLAQVSRLIGPGPIVLVTTKDGNKPNIMTMAWHMMLDFDPPLMACVIGEQNHTFKILKKTKECVLNIPTAKLAKAVLACGSASGRKTDKFQKAGLTVSPGALVKAPLVDQCYANIECKVVDTKMVAKYNLFILKGVKAWIDPAIKNPQTLHHAGGGQFIVDGKKIKVMG